MKKNIFHYSGAGNTFSIVWFDDLNLTKDRQVQIVKDVCQSAGTDGFIFLQAEDRQLRHLKWNFFNNDGSAAEMCGNATRCVAAFMVDVKNFSDEFISLETTAGLIQISRVQNLFCVKMTSVRIYSHPKYFWCDTGVPHIVIEDNDIQHYKSKKDVCRALRFHSDFLPRGTNVTLLQKTSAVEKIKAVTYERGVEDFTQACGTGAVAAALYNLKNYGVTKTEVEMPGGRLNMDMSNLNAPLMTGPAVRIGETNYEF